MYGENYCLITVVRTPLEQFSVRFFRQQMYNQINDIVSVKQMYNKQHFMKICSTRNNDHSMSWWYNYRLIVKVHLFLQKLSNYNGGKLWPTTHGDTHSCKILKLPEKRSNYSTGNNINMSQKVTKKNCYIPQTKIFKIKLW